MRFMRACDIDDHFHIALLLHVFCACSTSEVLSQVFPPPHVLPALKPPTFIALLTGTVMSNLELLAAAFSAILGVEVVTPQVGAQLGLPKLSIYELFHCTYVMRPVESLDPGEVFEITVKTLTGARIPIQVSNQFTIAEVKSAVQLKEDIHPRQQRLVFNSKALQDHETVGEVGIPRGGTIFLVVLV